MNYEQAMLELKAGKKIKLPEWTGGYWFLSGAERNICVHTRTGETIDNPYLNDYVNRTDWEVTDGLRDFSGALIALKAGKKLTRLDWNDKNKYLFVSTSNDSNDNSKYLFLKTQTGTLQLDTLTDDSVLAEDWKIVE